MAAARSGAILGIMSSDNLPVASTPPSRPIRRLAILAGVVHLYMMIAAFGTGYCVPGGMASTLMLTLGYMIGMPLQFCLGFSFLVRANKRPWAYQLAAVLYFFAWPILWCGGVWEVVHFGRHLVEAEISTDQLVADCQQLTRVNGNNPGVDKDPPWRRIPESEQPATIRRLRPIYVRASQRCVIISLGMRPYNAYYRFELDRECGKWVLEWCDEETRDRLVTLD